ARRGRAALSRRPLRPRRRQDPDPVGREGGLGATPHDRVRAPGPLRARSGRVGVSAGRRGRRSDRRAARLGAPGAVARWRGEGSAMNATRRLHEAGQSLWLDHITRDLLASGGLARYIRDLTVTGLTSNPTIFDHAIRSGADYDPAIRTGTAAG